MEIEPPAPVEVSVEAAAPVEVAPVRRSVVVRRGTVISNEDY
jgi:hypothetical protein